LVAAMLVLLAELLVPETGALAFPSLLAVSMVFSGCTSEKSALDLWRGNREYSNGRFDEALDRYSSAAKRSPADPRPSFNAADSRYRLGQWDAAEKQFSDLADPKKTPPDIASKALFNLGDTLFRKGDCAKAAEAFKQCLILDETDEDCRFNLVKSLECMKSPQQQDQKPKPQEQPKQNPEDQPKPPQNDRTRPKEMSQEDAERILQAIREREKAAKAHEEQNQRPKQPAAESSEADW